MDIESGNGSPFSVVSYRVAALSLTLTIVLNILYLAAVGTAQAQTPDSTSTPESAGALSYDEAQAQAIDRMLICPVCPAESIDQAQVPLARQMRQRVREMLSAGADRQEILGYFADRYGQRVLASPPKSGLNLLAWTLPVMGVLAALAAGVLVIRAMASNKGYGSGAPAVESSEVGAEAAPIEEDLTPYLAAVDQNWSSSAPSDLDGVGKDVNP